VPQRVKTDRGERGRGGGKDHAKPEVQNNAYSLHGDAKKVELRTSGAKRVGKLEPVQLVYTLKKLAPGIFPSARHTQDFQFA
jgi:hypothetical protein